jgi:hypothetical protein
MTKKTRLIPFDYQKYKAGAKAVLIRDPEIEILEIFKSEEPFIYLVISNIGDDLATHGYVGKDLLSLEQELEERTFYLPIIDDMSVVLHRYESVEDLRKNVSAWYGSAYKGALKITYTEEDLIK